jgi:probable rRNA maturation factor
MTRENTTLLFRHPSRRVTRSALRAFFAELTQQVAGGRAATCLVATDAELRRLNHQFRGRDYATDVLSFPSGGTAGPGEWIGEIAISLDRAAEQAAELGHGVEEELRLLMLHGVLHLTGFDHETDAGAMARAERKWRRRFGLPEGLIERTHT